MSGPVWRGRYRRSVDPTAGWVEVLPNAAIPYWAAAAVTETAYSGPLDRYSCTVIPIARPDRSFMLSPFACSVCITFPHLRCNASFAMLPTERCRSVDGPAMQRMCKWLQDRTISERIALV